jgi:chemotaxis protein methyltransferase CheR
MTSTLPLPNDLTSDPFYPSLKAYLIQATGLTYYVDKDGDLGWRLQRRFQARGVDNCAAYLNVLRDLSKGPAELDELIPEVTIGETHFFRHREHFNALKSVVLPNLLERHHLKRSLRIWCAGCSDGPEPYSLSILLKRDMAPMLAGWNVNIVATDINRRSLARAREGIYEEWAFRGTDADLKTDCFVRQGKYWQIAQKYKEGISFQYHNLVENPFPSLVNNLAGFDLIICRNVMIYFGPELLDKMIQQFHESLAEGGWLLVGPTEPNMTSFRSFCVVNSPGVTLFRKSGRRTPPAAAINSVMVALPPQPALELRQNTPTPAARIPPVPPKALPMLADLRSHADQGKWMQASSCCEQLLKNDQLNATLHFYNALILEQMGRRREVEAALKRAIYLDRRAVLPHYYLGLLQSQGNEAKQAVRAFENALALLQSRVETEVFADADGITVAELKKLIQMHLEILQI